MSGLCLGIAFAVVHARFPVQDFTLIWRHSVEHLRWEEDYTIRADRLVLTTARVQGNGAGMEPPADAVRTDNGWEYHPQLEPLRKISLANSEYGGGYTLCMKGSCRPLAALLDKPARRQPIDLFPCNIQ